MKKKGIDESLTGIIMGAFSVPTLLLSTSFNKMVHHFTRKCVYLSGLYMLTGRALLFGLIERIDTPWLFVCIAITSRLIIGVGMFQTKTVIFSIAAKRFPQKKDINKIYTYIGIWINIAVGVGPMLG